MKHNKCVYQPKYGYKYYCSCNFCYCKFYLNVDVTQHLVSSLEKYAAHEEGVHIWDITVLMHSIEKYFLFCSGEDRHATYGKKQTNH